MSEIQSNTKAKMDKAITSLDQSLQTIRTGRANPSILDRVNVDYYGSQTPLNQLASIQVVEGRQLVIKPFDKGTLKDMERAIAMTDLGLVPQNDGDVIRILIPSLTEDRRKELSKHASKFGEEAKIAIRNIRRDSNESIKRDDELSEDGKKQEQDMIQKITDDYTKKIDVAVAEKTKEIMAV